MKKLIALALCFLMLFGLTACAKKAEEEPGDRLPKAFGVLRDRAKLEKHGKKGESTSFSESDFESVVGSELTYITITELPDSSDGMLVFRGSSIIKGQSLPASQLSYLRFVPTDGSDGTEFGYTCDASGWQTTELKCVITLSETANLAPTASDGTLFTVEGIECEGRLQLFDPDGDEVTVNVISYPKEGFIEIFGDGRVIYTPNDGFTGSDTLVYTLVDRYGTSSENAELAITVAENESGIFFSDMVGDTAHLAAHQLCENNVMTYKYVDGEYIFEPDAEVKRIDFLVMLMCETGLSDSVNAVADSIAVDDDGLTSGLKGFLATAASKGVVTLDNGNFRPNSSVTLAEAAEMIASALSIPGYDPSGAVFGTSGDIQSTLAALLRDGIIDSADDPAHVLSRRECASMLYRAGEYIKDNNIVLP